MKNTLSPALRRSNYLHSETDAAYHELCLKLGISDSAMNLLYILCEQGDPCPLQLVYRFAFSSKQTVHSALRKLESEGVLRLEGDGPRNKQVCLTEKGRALAARTMEIFAQKGETPVYLHTQPWSWKAILLYMQLGFRLQRSDAFAAYENQTEQALRTLQAVLTPEQYAFVCAHCDD